MASKKPKCLTLAEKSEILEQINKGLTVTSLSQKYGVAKSTICAIKNKKTQILQTVSETISGPGKRRTLKAGAEPLMEQRLYNWFLKQRENQFPVSGTTIKDKAKDIHERLYDGKNRFNASDGWLARFKKRYGIRLSKTSVKKSAPIVLPFREQLRAKIDDFQLCNDQIYNAVHSGLFWKNLPGIINVGLRRCEKRRFMFMTCSNASGLHKLKPFVIGKTNNPSCFKDFSNPVDYTSSSWMTADKLKEWFHKKFVPQVKTFLEERNLPMKALLLLDSEPSHPLENELKSDDGNIFVMYLPPNIPPLVQQMDHVIKITKLIYRKHLLSSVVAKNPANLFEAMRQVTLREGVTNLAVAWDNLQADAIKKCWNKILECEEEDEDNIPLRELEKLLVSNEIIANIIDLLKNTNAEDNYTPDDIMRWNEDLEVLIEEECDVGSDLDEVEDNVNAEQAVLSFNQVITWAEQQGVDYSDVLVLRKLREKAICSNLKSKREESTLYSFFCVDQIE